MDTQQRVIISSDEGAPAAGRAAGVRRAGQGGGDGVWRARVPVRHPLDARLPGAMAGRAGVRRPWCPLLTAFRGGHEGGGTRDNVALDNTHLQRIQADVDAINRNLRRVVWNGRLTAGARAGNQAQLKAVLAQVNIAGARTRDRVAMAIGDLYSTALARASHQARELAPWRPTSWTATCMSAPMTAAGGRCRRCCNARWRSRPPRRVTKRWRACCGISTGSTRSTAASSPLMPRAGCGRCLPRAAAPRSQARRWTPPCANWPWVCRTRSAMACCPLGRAA